MYTIFHEKRQNIFTENLKEGREQKEKKIKRNRECIERPAEIEPVQKQKKTNEYKEKSEGFLKNRAKNRRNRKKRGQMKQIIVERKVNQFKEFGECG